MEVIPAIDLKGGRCVRLYQGDYSRETVFSEEPIEVALRWQSLGAKRLHIVDLDGASKGELCHASIIEEMARSVKIPLQLGGGLRRLDVIEQVLELGIGRAILGTTAIEDPDLIREACHRFGEAIIVSIDARDGYVATHGWREKTAVTAIELLESMAALGVRRFIYTDIARNGTLTEPSFRAIAQLVGKTNLPIIASGGISSLEHIKKLARLGVEGAIVGRALYTGEVDLKAALAVVGGHE
ncbi:MAG: 1-(5-phosphoribosyl)-5-[(5-phosphoribosylamino)methylideneamino]imidazole-4-carboxamide isomerase [Dehalococcoidia bacterium]|nr:1-(5-phosphoribosyl)-5-[(5-phosphoribosylamino)methylideneamino]imidazole-4-carboxamide isomerase [Dehalococcoidia bacterium]